MLRSIQPTRAGHRESPPLDPLSETSEPDLLRPPTGPHAVGTPEPVLGQDRRLHAASIGKNSPEKLNSSTANHPL
jgi:hypothetical protein